MLKHVERQLFRLLKIDFIRFCVVGGTGFVINLAILTFLNKFLGLGVAISQLIGAEIALFSNFILHNNWTYKHRTVKKGLLRLVVEFHLTSWPAIVGSTVMVAAAERYLGFDNLLALVTSSAIALIWNYVWSKYIVWNNISDKEIVRMSE